MQQRFLAAGVPAGSAGWRQTIALGLSIGFGGALAAIVGPAPAAAATLFALVNTGELHASDDLGVSWNPRATLPVRDAVALVAGETADERFVATSSGVVYRSADGGATWDAVGSVPAHDVVDLAILDDHSLRLLTDTGFLFQSADAGSSWTAISALSGANFVSLATGGPNRLYALARTGEVQESFDAGASWVPRGGVDVSHAVDIRSLDGALFILTFTGEVYRSADQGSTWTGVGALSQVGSTSLVRLDGLLAAATTAGEIARSVDGASWTWTGAVGQLTVTALATDEPVSSAVVPPDAGPVVFLGTPWPNPVSGPAAAFPLRLPRDERVALSIFRPDGRLVEHRAPEMLSAGEHRLVWHLPEIPSGAYLVRLMTASGDGATARAVVLR